MKTYIEREAENVAKHTVLFLESIGQTTPVAEKPKTVKKKKTVTVV